MLAKLANFVYFCITHGKALLQNGRIFEDIASAKTDSIYIARIALSKYTFQNACFTAMLHVVFSIHTSVYHAILTLNTLFITYLGFIALLKVNLRYIVQFTWDVHRL